MVRNSASQSREDGSPRARFRWPHSARAALSLTYDDSMPSHYQLAAVQLNEFGLRGTFFLNRVTMDEPWVALAEQGHELGAHTQHHPCPQALQLNAKASEDYDESELVAELDADVEQLHRLGQKPPFSFAYPCGVEWVGDGTSYVPHVRERFAAARGAQRDQWIDDLDLFRVPAVFRLSTTADLWAAVELAVGRGDWLVLGFHGIGSGWLVTEAKVHFEFLSKLAERSDLWIETFGKVAQHLRTDRQA